MVAKLRLPRSTPLARREDIVRKASALFLEAGFAATSMSTVAREVGGSKATIYKYFPNKESLFEAVIESNSVNIFGNCHECFHPIDNFRNFLISTGVNFLENIYRPEAILLSRVVIGDCTRAPQVGHLFFKKGPDRNTLDVARQLAAFARKGVPKFADPTEAAEDFFALLRGETHFRVLVGVEPRPDKEKINIHVCRVVDQVLHLWTKV